eukprot:TRINITY_DN2775_c0_g1_i1.p1 TRINITY_DN2775_c0_g1~~TRINITY_DN2775_c0_g1_i1.p1  ORF type:complete len:182 (-),score=30.14 TRINITY_DN2775_c0_g1_i1:53-598(-)
MPFKFASMAVLLLGLVISTPQFVVGAIAVGGFEGSGAYNIRGPSGYLNTRNDGSLFLSPDSAMLWFLGQQQDGSYWMKARSAGNVGQITRLEPVFSGKSTEPLVGAVRLNQSAIATWNITPDPARQSLLITAATIPPSVTFPSPGKVYLISKLSKVFWGWSGGILPSVPSGAKWTFEFIGE